ncbi:Hypothetical protein A7982_02256 [Minicystis rosea]|nr:Hypothetical protein A7982_02256 [Minicystis rosea]
MERQIAIGPIDRRIFVIEATVAAIVRFVNGAAVLGGSNHPTQSVMTLRHGEMRCRRQPWIVGETFDA